MIRKTTIVNCIFTVFLLYIISPWFFEKKLLFNELLCGIALFLLAYKKFRIGRDIIPLCMMLLMFWCGVHAVVSLARMDSIYYYFRNLVIAYSMLGFFLGYYLLPYLSQYINRVRTFLRQYIGIFLFIPLPRFLFERFGMATLFPALFKKANGRYVHALILLINIVYGITYDSLTSLILAVFYLLLFISPGYKFFKQVMLCGLTAFTILFIYLVPYLSLISKDFSFLSYNGILNVMRSNPILSIDGNSTWRLVLWKEVIVDNFPANIFGIGFGTPMLKYYPVEDYTKLASLPYVLGSHNSFVYLFGRLGIVFVLLIAPIYICIFREYFYFKRYYYSSNQVFIFWSFFAISMIALFNPTLESPIYAVGYWFLLGFLARAIYERKLSYRKAPLQN
jgi:hypothetical protein